MGGGCHLHICICISTQYDLSYTCDLRFNECFTRLYHHHKDIFKLSLTAYNTVQKQKPQKNKTFPLFILHLFPQIATWQKFFLLQNATSEKCGFEHTSERKGLEFRNHHELTPNYQHLFLQISILLQSLSIASI